MAERKVMKRCFMCGKEFQMGPDKYELHYIPRYDIHVCSIDYDGNWDGWAPHYEGVLLKHLKQKGLPVPDRNSKGWLPRN